MSIVEKSQYTVWCDYCIKSQSRCYEATVEIAVKSFTGTTVVVNDTTTHKCVYCICTDVGHIWRVGFCWCGSCPPDWDECLRCETARLCEIAECRKSMRGSVCLNGHEQTVHSMTQSEVINFTRYHNRPYAEVSVQ